MSVLVRFLGATILPQASLAPENAALRQQLALHQGIHRRASLRTWDRAFWMLLRPRWSGWKRSLLVVRPETVIACHRRGFRALWKRRARRGKLGRPAIPHRQVALIRRISSDPPEWGEDKLAEELAAKFAVCHSTSTIRRSMLPRHGPPRRGQPWHTLIRNHAREVWVCDFLTQSTASFAVAYVLVIMAVASRHIVHMA